MTGNVEDMKF